MKKLLLTGFLVLTLAGVEAKKFVITDFGVSTDSTQLNTAAIQMVIDKAFAKGGGTVVIPKGVFLSGALFFKPGTRLELLEGAVLKGSDNIADYPLVPSRMEGRKIDYYAALVNANKVENFSINGPGMINGNGLKYWRTFWSYRDSLRRLNQIATNLDVHRPRLIFINDCNHIKIKDVKLHNSGFWTTHLYRCTDILIQDCDIRAPRKPVPAPSSDGIDLDVCSKVVIRGCYISVNDDAVCIKGGKGPEAHLLPENGIVENVLVEKCTFGDVPATLTMGSECIHAKNITLRNCTVNHNGLLLNLKMRPDTYQTMENIRIENITGKCRSIINMASWKQFFDMGGSTEKPFGTVRNIEISHLKISCQNLGFIEGNPEDTATGIVLRDIQATAEQPVLRNRFAGVKCENVVVNGKPFELK